MDIHILEEAHNLIKPYSILRTSGSKWKLSTLNTQNSEAIKIHKNHSTTEIQINKNQNLDIYKPSRLHKRSQIRQNLGLFKVFQQVWETINPYKFCGISEKVYFSFFSLAYKQTNRDCTELLDRSIQIDKKSDFGAKTWLGFSELYDSVFEFLDAYTKSTASIEYIFLLKSILSALQDSKWCSSINLFSKLHLSPNAKPVYHSWMMHIMKVQEKKFGKEEVPDLIKIPNEFHVSERLLKRKAFKPVDRENFNVRKLEQMMNVHLIKGFKQGVGRGSTQNTARVRYVDKKQGTFYYNHLQKISPLSVVLKQSRSKGNILEKVIDGRKTMNFRVMSQKELLKQSKPF